MERNAVNPAELLNNVLDRPIPLLHIRAEGRSYDIPLNELDVGDRSTDDQVRNAAAEHLGIPIGKLRGFNVDRNAETHDITMAPPAVFG